MLDPFNNDLVLRKLILLTCLLFWKEEIDTKPSLYAKECLRLKIGNIANIIFVNDFSLAVNKWML